MRIKKLIAICSALMLTLTMTMTTYAYTVTQTCYKSGRGYKQSGTSGVETGWNGTLKGMNHILGQDDECFFTGRSYSRWLGSKPFYADKLTHYDVLEVKGTGSVSFSGGISVSSKGPVANFNISGTKSSKNYVYAYDVNNQWKAEVQYSYYADMFDVDWMDLFTVGAFRFGSTFVTVNARVDKPTVEMSPIIYS